MNPCNIMLIINSLYMVVPPHWYSLQKNYCFYIVVEFTKFSNHIVLVNCFLEKKKRRFLDVVTEKGLI